jgi:hypothetical protein
MAGAQKAIDDADDMSKERTKKGQLDTKINRYFARESMNG